MNKYTSIIQELQEALKLELPAARAHINLAPVDRVEGLETRIWPKDAKLSAVTFLLFIADDDLKLLVMKRTEDNSVHSGQISFPGGKKDPEDKDLQETAIREFFEETGVQLTVDDYLGRLSDLYIPPSNFIVQPFIAFLPQLPELKPNDSEVKALHIISLKELFSTKALKREEVVLRQRGKQSYTIKAPCYKIRPSLTSNMELCIWGATAMMIRELQVIVEENSINLPQQSYDQA